jgi:RNAse (barnase) inhibitor barstar
MTIQVLFEPQPPWTLLHVLEDGEERKLPEYLYRHEGFSPLIRVLRGKRMKSRQALMNEFAAAFQFFEEFGDNWYALRDCLIYLDDRLPADSYIVVITRPHELLIDEPKEELGWLIQTLQEVGEWWSRPIRDNPPFDRPAIPFHAVLQARDEDLDTLDPRLGILPRLSLSTMIGAPKGTGAVRRPVER